jgi:hypothetical protein
MKFEQLHAEEQIDLVIEALRMMVDARCSTLEKLIAKRAYVASDLWREICAECGYDCEPWEGWPAGPKRDFMKNAAGGGDRPLPVYWQKLLEQWQRTLPHMLGRQ